MGISISSARKITAAAELTFDGMTQEVIAEKLGVTRSRISQMKLTDTWQETIARLESMKQKADAEAEKRQQLLYSSDADRRFEQGRQMIQISVITYTKLMQIINAALDVAIANPDKAAALEQVRTVAPLIKAAVSLAQEVYGRNYDELEALKILADAGWLPRSILKLANDETAKLKSNIREAFMGILPDRPDEQRGRGLTPETAALLRSHILGIQPPEEMAEEEAGADYEEADFI
jgi:transcriptional regulator with XRE-family HTH domain